MSRVCWILSCLICAQVAAGEAWQRHTIDDSSRGADGVRLADANGDGRLDIATGWEEGGRIRIYLHPGPAAVTKRWPAVTVGKVKSPEDAVFVDLDGDGALDVVSCCEGRTKTVYIHWAPSDRQSYVQADQWKTDALPCTERQQAWMFALPLQIDGRHGIDLVVGSKGEHATIGWLEAPEDPRDLAAWQFHSIYQAGWIMSLQARDMDGDGDLDVLATDRKGKTRGLLWLENPGSDHPQLRARTGWPQHPIGGADREVMFLAAGNLGPANALQIVTAVKGRGLALFQPPQRPATTWSLTEIDMPAGCGSGKAVAMGDIDLDGRADLVFSCEHAKPPLSGVRWLSRGGANAASDLWRDHEISGPLGVKFDRLELIDLDQDGDLDVLTCEERHNLGVFWYENPTRRP